MTEPPQHMTALARANDVRVAIAEERRRIAALDQYDGRQEVARLLAEPPDPDRPIERMTVERLVTAIRRLGPSRARTLLAFAGIMRPNRRVSELTTRQRALLAYALRYPRAVLAPRSAVYPVPGEREPTDPPPLPLPLPGQTSIDDALRALDA